MTTDGYATRQLAGLEALRQIALTQFSNANTIGFKRADTIPMQVITPVPHRFLRRLAKILLRFRPMEGT